MPVPDLLCTIAFTKEEHGARLRMFGRQHQYGVGLIEAGEIIEVGVLMKLVVCVAVTADHARGRNNGNPPGEARRARGLCVRKKHSSTLRFRDCGRDVIEFVYGPTDRCGNASLAACIERLAQIGK